MDLKGLLNPTTVDPTLLAEALLSKHSKLQHHEDSTDNNTPATAKRARVGDSQPLTDPSQQDTIFGAGTSSYGKFGPRFNPLLIGRVSNPLILASISHGTWKSYYGCWTQFIQFAAVNFPTVQLPLSSTILINYIYHLMSRKLQTDTIQQHLSALKFIHHVHSFDTTSFSEPVLKLALQVGVYIL